MTDHVSLSSAELSFLLVPAEPAVRTAVYARLAIAEDEQTVEVRRAGMASLMLRGLLVVDGERYQVAPAVAAVYEGLTTARVTAQVGFVGPDRADGTLLFDTGPVRFFVAPRAYHTYDVVGLDASAPLAEQFAAAVRDFLRDHRPAVASIVVDPAWPVAPGVQGTGLSVAANESCTVVDGRANAPVTGLTLDDALARLRQALGELLPVTR